MKVRYEESFKKDLKAVKDMKYLNSSKKFLSLKIKQT